MKTLAPGEERFVVKMIDKLHRVYDRARGSFPYKTVELGDVLQDVAEPAAKLECDRLNKKFVEMAPAPKEKKAPAKKPAPISYMERKKQAAAAAPETVESPDLEESVPVWAPAEEVAEEDIQDYGVMSEEDRKKFEEGLVL